MSATIQAEIAKQKKRGQTRVKLTGEVFTPMDLCLRMVSEIPAEKLKDPNAKFLDNSCGDGNFLVALFKVLSKYHDAQHVLDNMIYGVDLMPDNVVGKEAAWFSAGDARLASCCVCGWFNI